MGVAILIFFLLGPVSSAAQTDEKAADPQSGQKTPVAKSSQEKPPRPKSTARRKRRKRPSRPRKKPAPKPISAAELRAITNDISTLNSELITLNRRTIDRFDGLTSDTRIPPEERFRFAGDFQRIQTLHFEIEQGNEDADKLAELADLFHRNHKFASAERYYLLALNSTPLDQNLLLDLAGLYMDMHAGRRAFDIFQEVLYVNPGNLHARLGQGWVRETEGNYAAAMTLYAGIEADLGVQPEIYSYKSLNLSKRGDPGAAVAVAREGLGLFPDFPLLYYAQAIAYAGLGMLDLAKSDLYDGLALDSDLLEAYRALGDLSLEEGNPTTAIRSYLWLIDEFPGDAELSTALGRAFLMDLRFADAVAELELSRFIHGPLEQNTHMLAQAYYLNSLDLQAQGQFQQAVQHHTQSAKLTAGQSKGWMVKALVNAGDSARRRGQPRRSLDYFEQALDMDPFEMDGYLGMTRTYLAVQDSVLALSTLRQALALNPENKAARNLQNQLFGHNR